MMLYISSLISFSVLTYIANSLGVLPTNKLFIPLFGIICFIFSIGVKVFSAASISNIKMDIEKDRNP